MRKNVVVFAFVFLALMLAAGQTFAAPVAHWNFDEGSGTVAGDSVGGNNATLVNGPVWSTDRPATSFPNFYALSFDGVDDYALRSGVVTTVTDNVTLTAWVKWKGRNVSTSGAQAIVYNGNSDNSGYGIYMWSDGRVFILVGGVAFVDTNIVLAADNRWRHLAAKREGGTWAIFLDGVQQTVTANSTAAPHVPLGSLTIGGNNMIAESFNGLIDDVRVYDNALSSSDISALAAPAAVPAMNGWWMAAFVIISGAASVHYLKKRKRA